MRSLARVPPRGHWVINMADNPYAQFVQAQQNPYAQFAQLEPVRQTQQQQQAAYQQALQQQADAMPFWQKALVGAGKAFTDVGRGAEQLVGLKPTGALAPAPEADAALMNTAGGKLGDFGTQALMMGALGGGLGLGARGLGLASKAVPFVNSALASGAVSGLQPVGDGESRLKNTLEGGAMGAAGEALPAAFGVAGRAVAPAYNDAKAAAIATANAAHIPLHLTQVANSRFGKVLGSAAAALPLSGAAAANEAQRVAWNRALASTMGLDATELTPQLVARAKSAAGADYDRVFGNSAVDMDPSAMSGLADAQAAAHGELLPENAALVDQQIDRVLNAAADNGGSIPGSQYQDLRNSLKQSATANPTLTHHLGAVRSALEDAANRQIPDLAPINARYKNIKTIEAGLKQVGGANNTIAPANLYHLTQGKFGATPQMQALAQLGQTVLKDPVANGSNTASHLLAYRLLGGGLLGGAAYEDPRLRPYLLPAATMLAGGATVGRAMNSPLAARSLPYLGSGMFNALSRVSVPARYMLPAASNAGLLP